MTRIVGIGILALCTLASAARADGIFFGYEGDIFPSDPGTGFVIHDACEPDCSEHIENGHYVLEWGAMGDYVQSDHTISEDPEPAPESMWVEWRFRSNQPIPATSVTCDARVTIAYLDILEIVQMFQDAVLDSNGVNFVLGLSPDFHTYRFESPDAESFTLAVDGVVFKTNTEHAALVITVVSFGGIGSCPGFRPQPVRNEWDYVRVGTLGSGEQLVSADPPAGNLTAAEGAQFHTFTITFDQPAYLYVNDISVSTTGGVAPTIVATRRPDNAPPDVLEVAIAGQLPPGETTTFTFDTGTGPQSVSYFREQPEVPATSPWGLVVMGGLAVVLGFFLLRRRQPAA